MKTVEEHITQNLYGFYKRVAEECRYEIGHIAGCDYVWNRKGTWPSYFLGAPDPDKIYEFVNAKVKGDAPSFWILGTEYWKEVQLLEKTGLRVVREWKGMALKGGSPDLVSKDAENHMVRVHINDPGAFKDWLGIVNTALMTGAQIGSEFFAVLSLSDSFRWVVAYMDNHPAGAGLSFSEDGVCGLYMIATAEVYRRQGIGTRVTGELVKQAIDSGDHTIVLHATGHGERIYKDLGFETYNRFSIMWHLGS
jgi:ribosomal protein S18 acetylase RimI-like enzyme